MSNELNLQDSSAREAILTHLDVNMVVEAGAGSGKTTSLVGRMLQLVKRGDPVDSIAAVTFTRKAANELRERFQDELERARGDESLSDAESDNLDRALWEMDRAFIGTIHSFCGRLLREYPLEIGIDPDFKEVAEEEWKEMTQTFWDRFLERSKIDDDPDLTALSNLGVNVKGMYPSFMKLVDNSDAEFKHPLTDLPDIRKYRQELESILARLRPLVPKERPVDGWDSLMSAYYRLQTHRRLNDWADATVFCSILEEFAGSKASATLKRWSDDKEFRKQLREIEGQFQVWMNNEASELCRRWREYRYPYLIRYFNKAVGAFEKERHATATFSFNDLLLLSARLLREHPNARKALGRKYCRLLVDEFQDTDPVQAEVCFLLGSDPLSGNDWRTVTPRSGSLFFVGDPKQSIYRFRRADIQVYDFAKKRIAEHGEVVALTQNFRSTHDISELVNGYFQSVFPEQSTDTQAAFASMQTLKQGKAGSVMRYTFEVEKANKDTIRKHDAEAVASWIAQRVESGERKPGDFLILTQIKRGIDDYSRALSMRNIPVVTTGAPLLQERDLKELRLVLEALADPENPIAVAAALEGLFFGCSPADLYIAHENGIRFRITHRPDDSNCPVSEGLVTLNKWWRLSQRLPGDMVLETILNDTGLLYYASSQFLGDMRAGVLLHLIEQVRSAASNGPSGITDVVQFIEKLLARDEAADTPLRPGHLDSVRVMNLHKAKGLEAPVVILASPLDKGEFAPDIYIRRSSSGASIGGILLCDAEGRRVAQPLGWAEMQAEEEKFQKAEEQRLLYVAVTRPEQELLVTRNRRVFKTKEPEYDSSRWSDLHGILDKLAHDIDIKITRPLGRHIPDRTSKQIAELVDAARKRAVDAASPSFTSTTVTESARDSIETERMLGFPPQRIDSSTSKATQSGAAWGRAVHRCIEALGRGRRGESLGLFINAVAGEEGLTPDSSTALTDLLNHIQTTDTWSAFSSADESHVEVNVMTADGDAQVLRLVEGVMDAAYRVGETWHVVDWKTDRVTDEVWTQREVKYQSQVDMYAENLKKLTGSEVVSRIERII